MQHRWCMCAVSISLREGKMGELLRPEDGYVQMNGLFAIETKNGWTS
jgi:hypothetical protein